VTRLKRELKETQQANERRRWWQWRGKGPPGISQQFHSAAKFIACPLAEAAQSGLRAPMSDDCPGGGGRPGMTAGRLSADSG
jgi:hypothetical protein